MGLTAKLSFTPHLSHCPALLWTTTENGKHFYQKQEAQIMQ